MKCSNQGCKNAQGNSGQSRAFCSEVRQGMKLRKYIYYIKEIYILYTHVNIKRLYTYVYLYMFTFY